MSDGSPDDPVALEAWKQHIFSVHCIAPNKAGWSLQLMHTELGTDSDTGR